MFIYSVKASKKFVFEISFRAYLSERHSGVRGNFPKKKKKKKKKYKKINKRHTVSVVVR